MLYVRSFDHGSYYVLWSSGRSAGYASPTAVSPVSCRAELRFRLTKSQAPCMLANVLLKSTCLARCTDVQGETRMPLMTCDEGVEYDHAGKL